MDRLGELVPSAARAIGSLAQVGRNRGLAIAAVLMRLESRFELFNLIAQAGARLNPAR
jgi:hypothetical protein